MHVAKTPQEKDPTGEASNAYGKAIWHANTGAVTRLAMVLVHF